MILTIEFLVKSGKFYLSGWPNFLLLDQKHRALRFKTKEEAIQAIQDFGNNHKESFQYTFKIVEEITIENNKN